MPRCNCYWHRQWRADRKAATKPYCGLLARLRRLVGLQ